MVLCDMEKLENTPFLCALWSQYVVYGDLCLFLCFVVLKFVLCGSEVSVFISLIRVFFYARILGDDKLFTIKMYHGEELSDDFYVRDKVDFFFLL